MDDFFNKHILEFGAVNITGLRIIQGNTRVYKEFIRKFRQQAIINSKSEDKFSEESSITVSLFVYFINIF